MRDNKRRHPAGAVYKAAARSCAVTAALLASIALLPSAAVASSTTAGVSYDAPPPTLAATSAAAQQAVSQVQQQASVLPPAQTRQQAAQQQAALQPAVNAVVDQGPSAARQLLTTNMNPSVAADLLKDGATTSTTSSLPASSSGLTAPPFPGANASSAKSHRLPVAHAASCYSSNWVQRTWTEYGAEVGWIYTGENGWCGSGQTITSPPGFYSPTPWTWGPYCMTNVSTNSSWDVKYSWWHMGTWGTLGTTYVWGCFGWLGGQNAVLRMDAAGYIDTYDDYGF
jgi:hypothetical protein